jgi:polar amino acid transport system permease protein
MLLQIGNQFLSLGIVNSLFIFLISFLLIRWYAKKKTIPSVRTWNTNLKPAFKLSFLWFIINAIIAIIFSLFVKDLLLYFSIQLCIYIIIDIGIGTVFTKHLYNKTYFESLKFILVIQLFIFIISIFLGFALSILYGFILPALSDSFFFVIRFGLINTVLITSLSLVIGLVLGLTLAIMRVYGGKELFWLSSGYEKLIRGIPLLVLMFIFAYGLPGLFWYLPLTYRFIANMILALGIRSSAYQSQIFRGAIISVNPGQMEAARSLGMTKIQSFRSIILPQAFRIAIPSWSNEFAIVIKDSSFASALGIVDITYAAYIHTHQSIELFTLSIGVVAVLYFLFTFPVTRIFGERQTKKLKKLGMGG